MGYSKPGTSSIRIYGVPDELLEVIHTLKRRRSVAEVARQALELWVREEQKHKTK